MKADTRGLLEEIRDLATALLASDGQFHDSIRHQAPDGLSRGGDGSRRAPGHSDPTSSVALRRQAALAPLARYQSFLLTSRLQLRMAGSLHHEHVHLVGQREERQSSLYECRTCGRGVTGLPGDRLKVGECNTCYMRSYRERNSGEDVTSEEVAS